MTGKLTTKNTLFMVAGLVLIIVLGVGGFLSHNSDRHKKQVAAAKQTVGNHLISLDQSSPSSNSSGLSVSGQADSLGQLGTNNKSAGTGSGSSSSSNDLDPSTFAQYDKYQSSPNALIGEIQPGSGAALAVGQKASIYYKVWLTNGTPVDQSPVSASGQPQPFNLTLGAHQVIPGLEQGIDGMKVGGKRLIIIPPAVGYGAQGQGVIPPNAVLVFEVQLVSAQ